MIMNATVTGDDTGSWATPDGDMSFRCPLPHLPEAVAPARRRAHTVLTSWNLPATTIEDAVLVISELVTNAVTHALPPAVLHLSRPGGDARCALRIEVSDAGPASCVRWPADGGQPAEHGRGSGIVTALSLRYGARAHRNGITRWADLPAA
ncbi:anti-sigma regulatory factor (Ser/Thr protein kinase) [Streptomyces sp. 2333.5]|nr:anti-sigma regulatory factor (Ser/Thr protein kinase) [Streptomyces sp. 2333.5]SEC76604.1 Anti-sigma regulatory factor (Ser/Thr protein kinase) [Streptomyces sp. 2314.4]SED56032.1 Anti-sigma regulatory factor (Ser/Thr protein kinase) [Streptomyces sp. 2112.2]